VGNFFLPYETKPLQKGVTKPQNRKKGHCVGIFSRFQTTNLYLNK